jgi:hypothetical protein
LKNTNVLIKTFHKPFTTAFASVLYRGSRICMPNKVFFVLINQWMTHFIFLAVFKAGTFIQRLWLCALPTLRMWCKEEWACDCIVQLRQCHATGLYHGGRARGSTLIFSFKVQWYLHCCKHNGYNDVSFT